MSVPRRRSPCWAERERRRQIAAASTFVVGAIGLFTALTAPARSRLHAIQYLVPTLAPESAAVTLVFISFALILTARGLRRGLRMARLSTIGLLGASMVAHVVHGSFIGASIPPLIAALWLATNASAFPVSQSPRVVRRAIVMAAGGSMVCLSCAAALAVGLDRSDLDSAVGAAAWRMSGQNTLPLDYGGRFATPALIAMGLCILVGTLWSLLAPLRLQNPSTVERHRDLELARAVVREHGGDTLAYFALRDDKRWYFHGCSVVAYAVRSGVCVVSPDPIGPANERADVWTAFSGFVERNGWTVGVLGASREWLATYEASGLRPIYLGDEAIIRCKDFTLEGRAMRAVRQAHSRVRRAGYSVAFHDPLALDDAARQELLALAELCRQGSFERGFSMTLSRLFDAGDDGMLVSIAYDATGRPQAFIQWVPCEGGWSLDVMRRNTDPRLTNGIIEYLIVESIESFAALGHTRVGLNFAVFRTVVCGEATHWFGRTARVVLQSAASQTQIESLWRFNAKFCPTWVPRYAVLGSMDAMAMQGVVMAGAEGLSELPLLGRFMTGMTRF